MNILNYFKAWFRREPNTCSWCSAKFAHKPELGGVCGMCNPPTIAGVVFRHGIKARSLDELQQAHEQAKAEYEAALLEQLAGLTDNEPDKEQGK